jgi:hypothetical protein
MNSKKYMYLVLGTVLVAGLLVVVSQQAPAQSLKTPQDVNIKQVNGGAITTTLPVSGSVGITGTPSVNAAQSGAWNVGIQDRDSKARNYYQTNNLSCGYAVAICSADLPVVPAGKRLVIERVSGEADMVGANDLYRVSLWNKNQSYSAFLEFGPGRLTPNNLYAHPFNAGVFAAFDAGQTPQLVVQSSGAQGFAWQAVITGYMVDIP